MQLPSRRRIREYALRKRGGNPSEIRLMPKPNMGSDMTNLVRRYVAAGLSAGAVIFGYLPAATCLMADRMRKYVPQRHRFPPIASSMSASLGCGLVLSRDTACMIWPAWQ